MTSDTTAAVAATDAAVLATTPEEPEDDWLTGATACSIENGEDCEACQ